MIQYYNINMSNHLPKQIIVIRHGEKPSDDKNPNLSIKGVARSKYLIDYFLNPVIEGAYNKPDIIYVYNIHKGANRSRELMQPLIDLKIPYNMDYDDSKKGTHDLVKDVFSKHNDNKTVLICWEHNIIPDIINEIGDNIKKNLFDKFRSWSNNPTGKKGDDDLYSLTIIIDPHNKQLIGINQSDDFSEDHTILNKLSSYNIIFKM
jgi:hypothetical protein